jgi:hypothetical protein
MTGRAGLQTRGTKVRAPIGTRALLAHRIGIICFLAMAFAGAFAGVVRYSAVSRGFASECRVPTNPACFGPYLR